MRTLELTFVRAERVWTKAMDCVVFQIAQFPSLCSLCLCALCVQRGPRGHAMHGIDVCCWEAASDTEDTEAQRTQRNVRLSRPFDTSGRTGMGGMRADTGASAQGSEPTFDDQARFMRRGSREARWNN